ncbi:ribbon-helix-helix protein, CopG family [Mesorhizobium sp. B2-9-1]|uniref:ribbon-helix-helix protein, CopG family n=1 Tax=unclassified Mesorhizobium TaxID=325217 RepID=UPI0011281C69|nr:MULTISPECIES: ribbon-helix-helix protein, CopG family [unclassified Mesorhizobium]TPI48017.1 ribbon-helix-helix protein, CopG family [Mesorhizobium sp. B2-9-1]TPJ30253.1 ribbon-helix-helix protein, CopG family [Mesorhizobium sp. B2-7-2]TPO12627.1 ribbon-helix-helix protein, CopG family [Mesorhizobium sp. B1-1-5]
MTAGSDGRDPLALDDAPADIRAAMMLRESASMPFDPGIELALAEAAAAMGVPRSDIIRLALREWLATNADLVDQRRRTMSAKPGNAKSIDS